MGEEGEPCRGQCGTHACFYFNVRSHYWLGRLVECRKGTNHEVPQRPSCYLYFAGLSIALMVVVWELLVHLRVGEMAGDSGALARTLIASKELCEAFQGELTILEYAYGGLSAVETENAYRMMQELESRAIRRDTATMDADSDYSD